MTTGDLPARGSDSASPLVCDSEPPPFAELCAKIHGRIAAFLDAEDVSPALRSLQEQTRVSLAVIAEALDKFRCVQAPVPCLLPR